MRNRKFRVALLGLATMATSSATGSAARPSESKQDGTDNSGAPTPEAVVDLHEAELGVRIGKPVDSGFVFFDGQYLTLPYTVSRRGMALFVDDKMIQPPFLEWPLPGDDRTFGEVDPALPEEVGPETSKCDAILKDYLLRKMAYLREHYAFDEAKRRMAQVYQDLPCVFKTEPGASDSELTVTWTKGQADNVILLPGRYIKWDTPTLRERLEETRQHYEDRLSKGDAYFFWSRGGRTTGGPAWVKERLPRALTILRSSSSDETKTAELQKRDALSWPADLCARLVATFSAPPELEERVAEAIRRYDEEQAQGEQRPTPDAG